MDSSMILDFDCDTTTSDVPHVDIFEGEISDLLDTYLLLFHKQAAYHPNNFLALQTQVTPHTRAKIIAEDMMGAVNYFGLSRETLHLAVNYMDRTLKSIFISANCLQLLGLTCLLIASKKEDVHPPRIADLIHFVHQEGFYQTHQFVNMEMLILKRINFRLEAVTAFTLLSCLKNVYLHEVTMIPSNKTLLTKTCDELVDSTLCNYEFSQYTPAVRAYACLDFALQRICSCHRYVLLYWASKLSNLCCEYLVEAADVLGFVLSTSGYYYNSPEVAACHAENCCSIQLELDGCSPTLVKEKVNCSSQPHLIHAHAMFESMTNQHEP